MTNNPEFDFNTLQTKIKHLEQTKIFHEQLIAYFSFEIRTPATMIQGYSNLLLKKEFGQLNDGQAKSIETIQKSAERIYKTQDEFRNLSVVARAQNDNLEKVDLSQFLHNLEEVDIGVLTIKNNSSIWINRHWLFYAMQLLFSLPSYIALLNRKTTLDVTNDKSYTTLQIITELSKEYTFRPEDLGLISCQIGFEQQGGFIEWIQLSNNSLELKVGLPVFAESSEGNIPTLK